MSMRTHTSEGTQVTKYTWYSMISAEKKKVKGERERRLFRESKESKVCRGRRGGKERRRAKERKREEVMGKRRG